MTQQRWEEGQTTLLALGLSIIALTIVAIAIDSGTAYLVRRDLQGHADETVVAVRTALADGSTGFDEETLARQWLLGSGVDANVRVSSAGGELSLTLSTFVPTTFLGLVGIDAVQVSVRSSARLPGADD